jgi:hypothetical protein
LIITLTDRLFIREDTFSSICRSPYTRTVDKIKQKSRRKAARKFARAHRMVMTLQTLPADIYKAIPKSSALHTVDTTGHKMAIDLDEELPTIEGLIGPSYAGHASKPIARLEDVIACHKGAQKEWLDSEPIMERGNKFGRLIEEYLKDSGFTTPTQICWSAPELVACLLHIDPAGGGRSRSGREILLVRLQARRYVDRSKMRTPKVVRPMPDELLSYLGEAKLLHTALKESK